MQIKRNRFDLINEIQKHSFNFIFDYSLTGFTPTKQIPGLDVITVMQLVAVPYIKVVSEVLVFERKQPRNKCLNLPTSLFGFTVLPRRLFMNSALHKYLLKNIH